MAEKIKYMQESEEISERLIYSGLYEIIYQSEETASFPFNVMKTLRDKRPSLFYTLMSSLKNDGLLNRDNNNKHLNKTWLYYNEEFNVPRFCLIDDDYNTIQSETEKNRWYSGDKAIEFNNHLYHLYTSYEAHDKSGANDLRINDFALAIYYISNEECFISFSSNGNPPDKSKRYIMKLWVKKENTPVLNIGDIKIPKLPQNSVLLNLSTIISKIKETGLLYEDNLIMRYACSLMTKPFVILSGLAGSGKTQLALAFARAMSEDVSQQLCVVPVGADWTNREPLLGYPNALKPEEYMLPESGVLQIMMRALRNPQKPYFLVLDEMNLSYVERYFADFLSALESHQEIPLWEKPDSIDAEVPEKIALPKNLFITGTINVDETTYMFSPKVLDRANVIEFKISEDEMDKFLKQQMTIDVHAADGSCAAMGQDFVEKATKKDTANSELAQKTLLDFFKVLKRVNAEFGYRSATEIYRFIANAKTCDTGMSEDEILDAAIVQKLLPKLHGSRKKLEPALKALWGLCMTAGNSGSEIIRENVEKARFKESADKIQRMMQTALENGFTSFAEA